MIERKIILASKSPRRAELMQAAGFEFEVKTKEVEENFPADLAVEKVAEYLAEKKANGSRAFLENDEIILTADTIVVFENEIFGKPVDEADAYDILKKLSGKKHQVITGVCLLSKDKKKSFSVVSEVYFDEIIDSEIEYYIKKFQPFDKAGAYGIQEWIGHCKINKIEGCYNNIKGLPMNQVYQELIKF